MAIVSGASDILLNEGFPDLSDEFVSELVSSIDRGGYRVVSHYLKQHELDQLRAFVEDTVRAAGNQYVCFTGCEELAGTPLSEWPNPRYSDGFARGFMNARREIRPPISRTTKFCAV